MIVTVTANTTMDLTLYIPAYEPDKTIRATRTVQSIGGKPTDASWILGEIGIPSLALGFAAGTIGERVRSLLHAQGVTTDFTPVNGESRINTVIIGEDDTRTTITSSSLEVTPDHIAALKARFIESLSAADCVILGGTLPVNVPPQFYTDLIQSARERQIPVIFDADEPNLSAGLAGCPTYIKPNQDELSRLVKRPIHTLSDAFHAGREIIQTYDTTPIISMGEQGLLAILPHKTWHIPPIDVPVMSTAGAGDAILAGLAASIHRGLPIEEGLKIGVAAATAVLLQPGTATCNHSDIEAFLPQVILQEWSA